MFKPGIRYVMTAALAAAALAGCDNDAPEPGQADEAIVEAVETNLLTGTLDRTFAGSTIPAVTLSDPEGATLATGDLGEGPVLLNMWATWCAPCVVEMPLLDELAADYGDDLRVLTVSVDLNAAVVAPFFEENGFDNLPRWIDSDGQLAASFGGGAVLPLTILYDAQGEEVWRVMGAYDWADEEAREAVAEALDGSST